MQRYGSILGLPSLQEKIRENLLSKGFDTVGLDIIITSGANQAFASIALAICDPCDVAGSTYFILLTQVDQSWIIIEIVTAIISDRYHKCHTYRQIRY